MIRALVLLLTLVVIGSAQFGSITLIPKTDDSATGELRFREKFANGVNYVGFKAPVSLSANVIWELPATDGTNGQCLTTNGSKVLSFIACAGYWSRTGTTLSPATAGDGISVGGASTFTNTLTARHIVPQTNATYDLGDPSTIWNVARTVITRADQIEFTKPSNRTDMWKVNVASDGLSWKVVENSASDTLFVLDSSAKPGVKAAWFHRDVLPDVTATYGLGSSSFRWTTIYGAALNLTGSIAAQTANLSLTLDVAGTSYLTGGAIAAVAVQPASNGAVPLGASSYRWSKTWTGDLDASGAVTIGGDTTAHHISPSSTATYDLGSSSYIWNVARTVITRADQIEFTKPSNRSDMWKVNLSSDGLAWRVVENSASDVLFQLDSSAQPGAKAAWFKRDILPSVTATYGLGSSSFRWTTIYGGALNVTGSITAQTANLEITLDVAGTSYLTGGVVAAVAVQPATNNAVPLGDTSYRWSKLWATDIDLTNDISARYYFASGGFYVRPGGSTVDQAMFASTSSGYFGTQSNHPMAIRTNNADRVTIAANGNVTFANDVTINGTCTGCGAASGWTRNGAGYLYPTTTGDSVIIGGTGTPGAKLEVVGSLKLGGAVTFSTGSAYDIGTSSVRAGTIYAANLNVSGTCTGCGGPFTLSGTTLYPTSTSSNLSLGGTSNSFGGKLEVYGSHYAQHIIPQTSAIYDLGDSTHIWSVIRSAYTRADQLEITRSGARTDYWRINVSTDGLQWRLQENSAGSTVFTIESDAQPGAGYAILARNFIPSVASSKDIGVSSYEWRNTYITGLHYVDGYAGLDSGTVTCGSGQAIKSLSFHGGIVTGYVCGAP